MKQGKSNDLVFIVLSPGWQSSNFDPKIKLWAEYKGFLNRVCLLLWWCWLCVRQFDDYLSESRETSCFTGAQTILKTNADEMSSYWLSFWLFLFATATSSVSVGQIPGDLQEMAVWPWLLMGGGPHLLCLNRAWLLTPESWNSAPQSLACLSAPLCWVTRVQIHPASISWALGECCCYCLWLRLVLHHGTHPAKSIQPAFLPNPGKTDEGLVSNWRTDPMEEYQALQFCYFIVITTLTVPWVAVGATLTINSSAFYLPEQNYCFFQHSEQSSCWGMW